VSPIRCWCRISRGSKLPWPPGWMCAIARNGATALDLTWKRDGKVLSKSTLTASTDGKTLTDVGGAPTTTEKVTAVYDRQ